MNHPIAIGIITGLVLSTATLSSAASDAPSDILAGPIVERAPERPTLVKRDFAGTLEPLDSRPEVAALALLELSEEQRAVADAFLTQRSAAVTAALFENMDLFLQLQTARQSGELSSARPLLRQFRQSVADLVDPPLVQQLAGHLPESSRAEFTRLVTEYKQALSEAAPSGGAMSESGPNPDTRRRGRTRFADRAADARYELSQLTREMARSLSTIVDQRRAQTEQLLDAIDATPEQRAAITAILRESAEQSRGPGADETGVPGAAQRTQAMTRIFALLTPEQRRRLRDYLGQP